MVNSSFSFLCTRNFPQLKKRRCFFFFSEKSRKFCLFFCFQSLTFQCLLNSSDHYDHVYLNPYHRNKINRPTGLTVLLFSSFCEGRTSLVCSIFLTNRQFLQEILKGEVSSVWQLTICFYLQNRLIQTTKLCDSNQSNRSTVQ